MKTRICLLLGLLLLICSQANSKDVNTANVQTREGAFEVFTSPELYELTMKWAAEYTNLNPNLKISVTKSSDNEISAILEKGSGIGIVADKSSALFRSQSRWNMVVGHDIIVPIMNAANPLRDQIIRNGITSAGLARIFENPGKQTWGMLTGNTQNIADLPIHYYATDDASLKLGVGKFLNVSQPDNYGVKTATTREMISAIQKDPGGFGFCKLIQITDPNNQSITENIQLIPIDKNGNGKIDYMENIYENMQAFARGVWIGKYPKALSGNIYTVSSAKPKNNAELAFLKWIISDGQQYLNTSGFSNLVLNERNSQLDKINEPDTYATIQADEPYTTGKIILLVLFALGLAGLFLDAVVRRYSGKKKSVVANVDHNALPRFDENSLNIPKGLYFDKTHTWAFMKKDGEVKIGIDDFLPHVTGNITRIEMRNSGEKIKKGDRLLTIIRNGKQLSIYAPVSGTITGYNESLVTNAKLINTSPYTDGWIYTIEPTNWLLEIQFLSMAEKYKTWLTGEFTRLKDFLATVINTDTPEYALVTLQDGGALRDALLADLDPEVWDDFQTRFIDVAK